jgi:hypothetical protein
MRRSFFLAGIVDSVCQRSRNHKIERLSTGATATPKNTQGGNVVLSYWDQKKAAKDRRRFLFQQRIARQERLPNRRSKAVDRGKHRRAFFPWFMKKKVDEEYMNRKARQAGLGWIHRVAAIVERRNIVLPDLEKWEKDYDDLAAYLALYRGRQYPKELFGVDYRKIHETHSFASSHDDLLAILPPNFLPAPRETEADKNGNLKTTERKLKGSIYLGVDDVLSESSNEYGQKGWQFPTVDLISNETLLEAAKRAIASKIGPSVKFWCPSNCPCAVHMVPIANFDKRVEKGMYGIKTFFIKVEHDEGDVDDSKVAVSDYAWLDRDEFVARIKKEQGDFQAKFFHYLL